ncbi:tyrosine-protein phosphatase Lar-like isoform X1 [Cherax quadricarinatus]
MSSWKSTTTTSNQSTTTKSISNYTMLCWSVRVLLLGLLLLTVTALDSEEQKKEKDHDFSATAGRGPPQNLMAEAVSSTAVYVSWDPPDDPPTKYTVLTEGDPRDTTNTFYQINDLSACTSYLITVTSVYDNEQFQAFTSATTDLTVPLPPQNCELSKITKTTMDVQWTDTVRECRITDHLISWSWDVLWSDEQGSNETFSNSNTIKLTNFKPYTNVTVNVAAGSSAGYGAPTTCWNVTLQDVPGAPVITSIEYSEHLLYITWSPPEEANGVILRYLVDIVSNGHHYTREYVTETEDVISDLPECTSYDITVTAETEPGSGPSDAKSTFLSGSVAPSFVTCDLGDGDHARVCWKPCSQQCFTGDLNYNISWSSDVLWSDTEDSGEDSWPWENKDISCYTLDSSVPYTNYGFCVGVVGQDIDTECCSVETPQTDTATSWNLGSEDIYKTFFTAAATNPSLWEGPTSTGESRLPVTMPSSAARPYPLTLI